jgi:acyl-CoA thioesterase-1
LIKAFNMKYSFILTSICCLIALTSGCADNRPRVLILGDSISGGYTPPLKQMMQDKAYIHRPKGNCRCTNFGLTNLDIWLAGEKWDVIHFNWGLHDVKYIDSQGLRTEPAIGRIQVPIDKYERNLEELALRLKNTGADLIFATTTPVPAGAHGRIHGDAAKYNKTAMRIMKKHGIAINDLYSHVLPRLGEIQRPANVHFTRTGSEFLAAKVAAEINLALASSPQTK